MVEHVPTQPKMRSTQTSTRPLTTTIDDIDAAVSAGEKPQDLKSRFAALKGESFELRPLPVPTADDMGSSPSWRHKQSRSHKRSDRPSRKDARAVVSCLSETDEPEASTLDGLDRTDAVADLETRALGPRKPPTCNDTSIDTDRLADAVPASDDDTHHGPLPMAELAELAELAESLNVSTNEVAPEIDLLRPRFGADADLAQQFILADERHLRLRRGALLFAAVFFAVVVVVFVVALPGDENDRRLTERGTFESAVAMIDGNHVPGAVGVPVPEEAAPPPPDEVLGVVETPPRAITGGNAPQTAIAGLALVLSRPAWSLSARQRDVEKIATEGQLRRCGLRVTEHGWHAGHAARQRWARPFSALAAENPTDT